MRVLVVGGGIGGMATAIALERVGLEPVVLERAPALTEIGAGLGLTANAMKAMNHLGAGDFVRSTGIPVDRNEWRSIDDGHVIFTQRYAAMEEHYGEQYVCMHRADLLESLVRLVPSDRVRLDHRLVDVREDPDGVTAVFEDGEEVRGDLLIGADGLRSTVRTVLFGESEARFTGVACWRGLIPLAAMPPGFGDQIVVWPGRGRHAMTYPVRDDLVAFNGFVPADEIHQEGWLPSGADMTHLKRSFAGAHPDVLGLIDGIDEVLITPIYFRDPLPVWGTDRVVLLGDAAHPAPSSAGQGAAMALEDALTLAAGLRRGLAVGGDGWLGATLRDYAGRRRLRTARMLVAARVNLAMFNEPDPVQMHARNGRLQGMLRVDPVGESSVGWLYAHDPVAAAEEEHHVPAEQAPPMGRPEAQRAYDAWRDAVSLEDRAGLWRGERAGYERFLAREFPPPEDLVVQEADVDGVPGLVVVPPGADRAAGPVVLHLHGGGFTMGSARGSVELAGRLARAVGGWALTVDYRLGPEHAFPAALDDALTAYRWLRREHPGAPVVVSGECAGGGLVVSLALALRDAGEALPASLHAVSPFCDLTLTSASIDAAGGGDPWMNRDRLRGMAASYLHTADPADPAISPALADLQGLPPLLVQAAAAEALAGDAVALAEAAARAGVDVTLELADDTVHSYVLWADLPETAAALERLAAHVAAKV